MISHDDIDRRSLLLAEAIVKKLERTSVQAGILRAREVNRRWREKANSTLHEDWARLLAMDWPFIRQALLDPSERGCQLRQNNPFCGILSPQERWTIYREFQRHAA